MSDLLTSYDSLPNSLSASTYAIIQPRACIGDVTASDCSYDGVACINDSSCTSDGVCTSDNVPQTPSTPTITYASGGNKSISWGWTSVSGATYYQYAYREAGTSNLVTGTTTNTYITIYGLKSNTTYVVNVEAWNSAGGSGYGSGSSATTTQAAEYWSWSSSNGSATVAQTQAAYTAVTSKGKTSNFSYLVWNDMCDKVMEVRLAAGVGAWDTSGSGVSYNETIMSSSDKILTATRFNSFKYNIGSQYPTGISDVSTGDIVYGSYFTSLMSTVNNWIDSL